MRAAECHRGEDLYGDQVGTLLRKNPPQVGVRCFHQARGKENERDLDQQSGNLLPTPLGLQLRQQLLDAILLFQCREAVFDVVGGNL